MKLLFPKNIGFCFGVKRAIELAESNKAKTTEKIYTLGPLIHNEQEIARLASNGIEILQENDLPTAAKSTIITRSHGIGPATINKLQVAACHVVDATCPFVKKAQKKVWELAENGYQVIIFGDKNHPEVVALKAWCNEKTVVISSENEANSLELENKCAILAQTTEKGSIFIRICDILIEKQKNLEIFNTICNATSIRQKEVEELAAKVDKMLIIGGKSSSNTLKLVELCQKAGKPVFHIEEKTGINPAWFEPKDTIGIATGASTPDWIIEEVIRTMQELDQVVGEESMENEMLNYDFGSNLNNYRKGDVVRGTVVQVKKTAVIVDIGIKAEGVLPLDELGFGSAEEMKDTVKIGDSFDVMILNIENEDGYPLLSKKRADMLGAWDKLQASFEAKEELKGVVAGAVKGGLSVNIGNARAFMPASQVERFFIEDLNVYTGATIRVRIIELNKEKNRIIISQKAIIEEENSAKQEEVWSTINEGDIVIGVVSRITNFGAFIDLGGVDGLLHISEISWKHYKNPADILTVGQQIKVKVISMDKEKKKISLSAKELLENPWQAAEKLYPVDVVVKGKVVRIAPFGAFIELEEGVEGLVHISQVSEKKIAKVEEVLTVGEIVDVRVLGVDLEKKRISLSIKATKEQVALEVGETVSFNEELSVTVGDVAENI